MRSGSATTVIDAFGPHWQPVCLVKVLMSLGMLPDCRLQPWASHFKISNVNKDLKHKDRYTFDLEWSPDGINPPLTQNVIGVPPALVE